MSKKLGKNGFLGIQRNMYMSNKRLFISYKYAKRLNKLIYEMLKHDYFGINELDLSSIYIVTSFFRTHKTFQSFIILSEKGLKDDSLALLRIMFENLFKSAAIIKDYKNFEILLKEYWREEKGLKNIKRKGLGFFANEAKLSKFYSKYEELCKYVHFDINNLGKNVNYSYFKKIKNIYIGQDITDIEKELINAIKIMINFIEILRKSYFFEMRNGNKKRTEKISIKYEKFKKFINSLII